MHVVSRQIKRIADNAIDIGEQGPIVPGSLGA
jgi:hypothetical protein